MSNNATAYSNNTHAQTDVAACVAAIATAVAAGKIRSATLALYATDDGYVQLVDYGLAEVIPGANLVWAGTGKNGDGGYNAYYCNCGA